MAASLVADLVFGVGCVMGPLGLALVLWMAWCRVYPHEMEAIPNPVVKEVPLAVRVRADRVRSSAIPARARLGPPARL